LEDTTGNKTTLTSPSVRWTDTQNGHQDLEGRIPDTQYTPELQERKTQRTRGKSRNTRHTLQNLDRKLDKIHRDLARVSWSQTRNEPQQRPRPLIGRNPQYKPAFTYELTPTAARVVFRILDPHCIQWLHVDQKIIVKNTTKICSQTTLARFAWPRHADADSCPRLCKISAYTRSSCHPNT